MIKNMMRSKLQDVEQSGYFQLLSEITVHNQSWHWMTESNCTGELCRKNYKIYNQNKCPMDWSNGKYKM